MNPFSRRQFMNRAAGAAALPLVAAQTPKPPNLVFVYADQLGYHHCGYAGDEYARTPNIDRLAAQGCNLRQTVSNTPVCSAYRASLLTGKHTSSTGMVINEIRMSPEHECFGHVLGRHNYRTAFIGKWHLWAGEWGNHELLRNGFVPPGRYRLGFDDVWAGYNFSHEYYGAPYYGNTPERRTWAGYEPDSQTTMAIDFIRQAGRSGQPFATFLAWGPPHAPWQKKNVPPDCLELFRDTRFPVCPNFSDKTDPYTDDWGKIPSNYRVTQQLQKQIYYGQTVSVDRNLGRLMQALDDAGLADNTILVFSSDHGEMFGAQGHCNKLTFYEEAARIPMLVRWPGRVPAHSVSEIPMGTPDMMPTLLSMMGLPVPRAVEGVDCSSQILGRGGSGPDSAVLQGMGATAAWVDGTEWRALRDNEYTYAVYHRDGRELLFNQRQDPFQMADRAADRAYAATLKHYRDQLTGWRKQHNDTFESCTWYRDHWTKNRNIIDSASGVKHDLQALDRLVRGYLPEGLPVPER